MLTRSEPQHLIRTGALGLCALAAGACVGALGAQLSSRNTAAILGAAAIAVIVGVAAHHTARVMQADELSPLVRLGFVSGLCGLVFITLIAVHITSGVQVADALLLTSAACIGVASAVEGRRLAIAPPYLVMSALGLLIMGMVAAVDAGAGVGSNLVKAVEFSGALLLTPILVACLAGSRRRMNLVLLAWSASVVINGAVGILDDSAHLSIGAAIAGRQYAGRQAGLTLQPNDLGVICAMIMPIALTKVMTLARRPAERIWYGIVLLIAIAAILVSGSRAALLAWVVVLVIAFLARSPMRAKVGALIVVLAVAVPLIAVTTSVGGSSQFAAITRLTHKTSATNAANSSRFFLYTTAITSFTDHPATGIGFSVVRQATDIYLQVLQAGGIFALAAFLLFVFGTLRLGLRYIRPRAPDDPDRILALAFLTSFGVWLFEGFVQNDIYNRYLFIPVGLLLAMEYIRLKESDAPDPAAGVWTGSGSGERAGLTCIVVRR